MEYSCDRWEEIAAAFEAFFSDLGVVTTGPDELAFDATPRVATRLVVRSDGTSDSFMPLHGLQARWDRIRFNSAAAEVVLESEGLSYTYRVPPALRT